MLSLIAGLLNINIMDQILGTKKHFSYMSMKKGPDLQIVGHVHH